MENKLVNEGELTQKHFIGIKDESSKYEKAKAVILPVPYGATVTHRKGTENGPRAIIDASCSLELFDEELGKDTSRVGINTARELEVQNLAPEAMVKEVNKKVSDLIADKKFPVILGGEHSVSIGAVKALHKTYKDLSVFILDAHYDLRDDYKGSKFNHACVARRISEMVPVVEAGMRSMCREEKNFFPNPNVIAFSAYDILDIPNWKERIKDSLSENVYISIDLDAFDPAVMPSVGTPMPGGLVWYETLDLLRYIISNKNIVGLDIVELCPIKDNIGTDVLAAKLVYRLLGYVFLVNNKAKPLKEENSKKEEKAN